jgi:hypothetical protein
MPASRHQDHTISPSASGAFVLCAIASTASREPNVRDDREAPLVSGRDVGDIVLIWVCREAIYFFGKDWTGSITLIGLDELPRTRRRLWCFSGLREDHRRSNPKFVNNTGDDQRGISCAAFRDVVNE